MGAAKFEFWSLGQLLRISVNTFFVKFCPLLSPCVLWCPLVSHSRWPSRRSVKTHVTIGDMRKKRANALRRSADLRVFCVADSPADKPWAGQSDPPMTHPILRFPKTGIFRNSDSGSLSNFPVPNRRKSALPPIPYTADRAVPGTYDKSKSAYADFDFSFVFIRIDWWPPQFPDKIGIFRNWESVTRNPVTDHPVGAST
jgi:hypothetical protein